MSDAFPFPFKTLKQTFANDVARHPGPVTVEKIVALVDAYAEDYGLADETAAELQRFGMTLTDDVEA